MKVYGCDGDGRVLNNMVSPHSVLARQINPVFRQICMEATPSSLHQNLIREVALALFGDEPIEEFQLSSADDPSADQVAALFKNHESNSSSGSGLARVIDDFLTRRKF